MYLYCWCLEGCLSHSSAHGLVVWPAQGTRLLHHTTQSDSRWLSRISWWFCMIIPMNIRQELQWKWVHDVVVQWKSRVWSDWLPAGGTGCPSVCQSTNSGWDPLQGQGFHWGNDTILAQEWRQMGHASQCICHLYVTNFFSGRNCGWWREAGVTRLSHRPLAAITIIMIMACWTIGWIIWVPKLGSVWYH